MNRPVAPWAIVIAAVVGLLSFPPPPLHAAAKTPEELLKYLNEAAEKRDADAFLAELTADSQKALKDSAARRESMRKAGEEFRAALDERFGKGAEMLEDPPDTLATSIARVAGTELIDRADRPDGGVELRVRIPARPAARASSRSRQKKASDPKPKPREQTLVARREGDAWKLALAMSPAGDLTKQVATAKRITDRIRAGEFKDRYSAMMEWSNAWSPTEAAK